MNVLRTWELSGEGQLYLGWLIEAAPELDGGDVLREAVLDILEEPSSRELDSRQKALDDLYAELPQDVKAAVKEHTEALNTEMLRYAQAIRAKVEHLRNIREILGCSRMEALERVADMMRGQANELQAIFCEVEDYAAASAKLAAASRTTLMTRNESTPRKQPDQCEDQTEHLDRHYAEEIVGKLEAIVERASRLSPVKIGSNNPVRSDLQGYFLEAHQCYLYGFPVASVVLCRAIIEAVLTARASGKNLAELIHKAYATGLLSQETRDLAHEVKQIGNRAIHDYEQFAKGDLNVIVAECLMKTRAVVEYLLANGQTD